MIDRLAPSLYDPGMDSRPFLSREDLLTILQGEILTGRIREGEKLPSERRLAGRYRVSRPVVRETLRTLGERGLIEVVPGRGTFVRRARVTDVARSLGTLVRRRQATPRNLAEARKMVECEAAFLAATRAEPEDLAAMEMALSLFKESTDVLEKVRQDVAFHASIARATRNPVIEILFASISDLAAELMLRSLSDPDVSRAGLPFHEEIFAAIRDGEPERARAAMAGHLMVAEKTYGEDYDRKLSSLTRQELGALVSADVEMARLAQASSPAGERSRTEDR